MSMITSKFKTCPPNENVNSAKEVQVSDVSLMDEDVSPSDDVSPNEDVSLGNDDVSRDNAVFDLFDAEMDQADGGVDDGARPGFG